MKVSSDNLHLQHVKKTLIFNLTTFKEVKRYNFIGNVIRIVAGFYEINYYLI